ncbi:hypothetical protein [Colwellia sp. RSH04]|uniref:hypothetical protein n=1 Tax=Colwellia sp. RSH04 TaxID=2305464 RepID=UPI000E595E1D|nr:hypothetical protein [Colwellia sp. RSH04]RHW74558.1 hypothetical protein D1094_18290 [Colwellia sp. RSH04]
MNLLVKITAAILFLVIAFYYLYFYITPSVTVINKSDYVITRVNVTLPESNLNFGSIELEQANTIHYSLSQHDGSYKYSFNIGGKLIAGACGYLTNNELNKRFVITVNNKSLVDCSQ